MTYAFRFDASSCSGCKACQLACKDKNNLPTGVLWRRVIEVTGGDWTRNGGSWLNSVFSYSYSAACNHCEHPKCAGVCPTNAYQVRPDGIVLLDSSKCVGCGYCNWACPYAVPQYNRVTGRMSKCNFCYDALDNDLTPACVAACPLRALDFFKVEEMVEILPADSPGLALWKEPGAAHPFPLPAFSRTQPHVWLKQHPAMSNPLDKKIANTEEIKPAKPKSEVPLVAFTLLIQMAIGMFWNIFWFLDPISSIANPHSTSLLTVWLLIIEASLLVGMLVSFAHLGSKENAWRVVGNLKKSWLSREILSLGLFGISSLFFCFFPGWLLGGLTACLGVLLLISMANVYRLRTMPKWNRSQTLASFVLSALLLGQVMLVFVLWINFFMSGLPVSRILLTSVSIIFLVLLAVKLILILWDKKSRLTTDRRFGISLLSYGIVCLLAVGVFEGQVQLALFVLFSLLIILEEVYGRSQFYSELEKRIL